MTIYLYSWSNKKDWSSPKFGNTQEFIPFFGNIFPFTAICLAEIFFLWHTLSFCVFLCWLSFKSLSPVKKVLLTFATVRINRSYLLPLICLFSLSASLKSWTLVLQKAVKPRSCLHILLTEICDIPIILLIFLWLSRVPKFSSWLRISSSTSSTFLLVRAVEVLLLPGIHAKSPVLSILHSKCLGQTKKEKWRFL